MSTTVPSPPLPLHVLLVCTGNVCRSAFAERLVHARAPQVPVSSRGTHALDGSPMDRAMVAELERRGVGPADFRARQVSPLDLQADLILTMTIAQRRHLLEEEPSVARRTGLLGAVPHLARLVTEEQRGLDAAVIARWSRTPAPRSAEVPDPFGRGSEQAARSAAMLDDLVGVLAALLTPGASAASRP